MSLDKSIISGKEFRKQYRRPKSVDTSCRNHGDCWHCYKNRLHSIKVRLDKCDYKLYEYNGGL